MALIGGLAVIVVGGFLPWVHSGRATRNGYAAGGISRRLLGSGSAGQFALSLVPFAALACALSAALVVLAYGSRRTGPAVLGRVLAVAVAAGSTAGAIVALSAHPGFGVTIDRTGPGVVIAGSAIVGTLAITAAGRYLLR